ncbi:hypothetical protein Cantr_07266 [Candida viswanathii]|uniref:Uncharacterized protein n=1 Tax=Candida viswanathii TaxID=5486 RepID=A0A367Y0P1_9ASCO|nr:hypothetical protein Cantr_07266 [Candida viswanathii]
MSYYPTNNSIQGNTHLEPVHYHQYGSETSSARSSIDHEDPQLQHQQNTYNPIPHRVISNDNTSIESSSIHEAPQYPTHTSSRSSKRAGKFTDNEKHYRTFSRAFLCISLASAILILLFEAYMYAVINIHRNRFVEGRYEENSIYFALFIFAAVFQVVITIIALYSRNLLLLVFLMGFYCAMLIYTGIQYNEVGAKISVVLSGSWETATQAMNIATICVIAVTLICQSALLFFGLRRYVSWFIFKKIGASLQLKKMYAIFQIHRSILMFDFFFFTGFTIQFLVIMVRDRSSVEFILTVIVLPLTIVLLYISDISATREFIYGSLLAIALYMCGIAYVLFKIIRLYTKYTSAYSLAINPGDYFMGRKSLLTFGIITLVLLVATIVLEIMVIINFKKGLLPAVSLSYKWIPGYNKDGIQNEINISDEDGKDDLEKRTSSNSNSLTID